VSALATTPGKSRLSRRPFIVELMSKIPVDALVVTGLGSPSYDVFASGDGPTNFYLWGAMGAAVPLGLGLALAQPHRPVVVITGDGEQLMGIGALGTVAVRQPSNLMIVVLDNGHFGETGMQPSHSSLGTDLMAVARGFGIADAFRVEGADGVGAILARIRAAEGPAFAHVLIDTYEPPRALPPRDGTYNKNAFRAALGLHPF
jgi:thiamine pyrophosphate-dependent acetolactate synthase large subunit-like protein